MISSGVDAVSFTFAASYIFTPFSSSWAAGADVSASFVSAGVVAVSVVSAVVVLLVVEVVSDLLSSIATSPSSSAACCSESHDMFSANSSLETIPSLFVSILLISSVENTFPENGLKFTPSTILMLLFIIVIN